MIRRSRLMISIIIIMFICISLSACDPLRKKFTRQKKRGDAIDHGFIPVLQPQEYPEPANNPSENYKEHYGLLKSWYRDLWSTLQENNSDKKTRYTLKEVYLHLDEMQKLIPQNKQGEMQKLRNFLKYYEESLDSPLAMRNISRIQSDLRAFDRQLRGQFSPKKIYSDDKNPSK